MTTNRTLDDKLIRQVQQLGKFKSKSDAVNAALREFVQHHGQAAILEFAGKVEYYPDFDYKRHRPR